MAAKAKRSEKAKKDAPKKPKRRKLHPGVAARAVGRPRRRRMRRA